MNRRNFLRLVAAAVALPAVPLPAVAAGAPAIAPMPMDFAAYLSMRHRVAMLHIAEMMEDAFFAPAIKKIALESDAVGWMPVRVESFYKEQP